MHNFIFQVSINVLCVEKMKASCVKVFSDTLFMYMLVFLQIKWVPVDAGRTSSDLSE